MARRTGKGKSGAKKKPSKGKEKAKAEEPSSGGVRRSSRVTAQHGGTSKRAAPKTRAKKKQEEPLAPRPHVSPAWQSNGDFVMGDEAIHPGTHRTRAKKPAQPPPPQQAPEPHEFVHQDKKWGPEWQLDPKIGTGAHASHK